jgi:hypothetical protein
MFAALLPESRLTPSELFPTEVRSTAHGFSSACGKLGALFAGVFFAFQSNQGVRMS